MTTARPPHGTPSRRAATLPVAATVVIGVVLGVVAAVVADSSAVWGVVVGILLTLASLGLGSLVLAWVTEISPGMSLVVALMTYTLQVVLLLTAYVVLSGSEAARDAVSGPWLGTTVIATTVVWLGLQVQALRTSRQPYLEPASPSPREGSEEDATR